MAGRSVVASIKPDIRYTKKKILAEGRKGENLPWQTSETEKIMVYVFSAKHRPAEPVGE